MDGAEPFGQRWRHDKVGSSDQGTELFLLEAVEYLDG